MASISYFLRGKIPTKDSTIYLRFRDKSWDIVLPIPYLSCKPSEWKDGKCKVASQKMSSRDDETINVRLLKLETEILNRYKDEAPEIEVKEWLQSVIDPRKATSDNNKVTDDVLSFYDFYIETKSQSLTSGTIRDIKKKKNLLSNYIKDRSQNRKTFRVLRFKNLDNNFRIDFENYFKQNELKPTYFLNNLKTLKTLCRFAYSFDIEVHKHSLTWRLEFEKVLRNNPKSVYLTLEELEIIGKTEMPHDYLDNAKDWLLIACFTGQRASDFLRFNHSMITVDSDGREYLEFIQKKTSTKMKIPLLKKVREILDKREGDFPRPISDVKLNLYIKEVCKVAEIDELVFNEKTIVTKEEGEKSKKRKIAGTYPKHELITSHIGRKSFATNFYEKIPTPYLMNFTGHTTEKQLLTYINKTDNEKAKSTAEVFSNLGY